MVPTLRDAQRFLKPDGILLPEKIQIIYQPLATKQLSENLVFQDIELLEMTELLTQIHPSLRARPQGPENIHSLPEICVKDLLGQPYAYTEINEDLQNVDAVEVSFNIIHGKHKFQAAKFATEHGLAHWHPLYFYKLDVSSNEISFFAKDNLQLGVV